MVGLLFQILLLGITGSLGQSNLNPCGCEPCKNIPYGHHAGIWSLLDNNSSRCVSGGYYWNACLYKENYSGAEMCFCDPGPFQYESCYASATSFDFLATDKTFCSNYCPSAEGCPIKQNHKERTLLSLGKQFKISFEFKAIKFITTTPKVTQNVISLSTTGYPQDRVLEMGIYGEGYMYFCNAIHGYENYPCTQTTTQYVQGVWYTIEMTQVLNDGNYMYTIKINDKLYITGQNPQPIVYNNVNEYVSAPWVDALDGYVKNLTICAH